MSRLFSYRGGLAGDLLVVGVPLAGLYVRTVSRDLGTVDSGELAAAAATLSIAHPTGYPLYLLLARSFAAAVGGAPIAAVNLLSALTVVAVALAVVALARGWLGRPEPGRPSGLADHAGPWAAGWLFGTHAVLWEQATGNEVYALHLLFVATLLRQAMSLSRGPRPRELLLTAWLAGLAAAHHLSVVFIAPAMAVGLLSGWFRPLPGRFPRRAVETDASLPAPGAARPLSAVTPAPYGPAAWAAAAGLFLLAWSVVLVLPVRSALDPPLDWGDPRSWSGFWRHVLAAQYRVWLFESGGQWTANLSTWIMSLPARLSWPVLALVPAGLWWARARRRELLILIVAFAITAAWASSYSIHDLAPYYLPADLVLVLLAAAAIRTLAELRRRGAVFALVVAVALASLQAVAHFPAADRSRDRFVRFHAEATMRALPERSILLSRFWDAVVSPAIYLQAIEHQRPDVTVVDPELLRRSWYFPQLRRTDPALLPPLEPAVRAFVEQVALFEAGRPYDPAVIEARYHGLLRGIAQAHRPARPTAFTAEVEGSGFHGNAAAVPEGLVYLLRDGPEEARAIDPPDVAGLLAAGYRPADRIHRLVILSWAHGIAARVRFLEAMGREPEAMAWREAARAIAPAADEARRRGVGTP